MNNLKVSVIIPVYKPDFWLDECLQSIANQTMGKDEYEVILILNGDLSYRDYVQKAIDNYLKDNKYQYFETDFGNVSNARNIGLDNAYGEYIIFVDSDDVVSEYYLQGLYESSSFDAIGVCYTELFFKSITESYKSNFAVKKEYNIKRYKSLYRNRKCLSGPCGKCIHRNIIEKERFDVSISLGEDVLFWLALAHKIDKLKISNSDSVYYIRESRGDSLSRAKYNKFFVLRQLFYRNYKIIRLFLQHPIKNDFLLFCAKFLSSTRGGVRMLLK